MILTDRTMIYAKQSKGTDARKPVAVFIHGDGQNHTIWTALEGYFSAKGHGTLSYDLPGHGLSTPYVEKEYSFGRFADTLEEIIKGFELDDPLLVGNSSGGMIALEYATKREVSGVIAISSSDVSPTAHNPKVNGIIEAYILRCKELFEGQRLFRYDRPGLTLADIGLAALKYTTPGAIEGNMAALKDFDIRDELYRIRAPVLAIRGTEDPYVTEETMGRFEKRIPKAETMSLLGQGHHVLLEDPELILKTVDDNYSFLVQS
jgi:peroxiredoxin